MFKKVLSGIMALSLISSFAVISASAASKGDVDGSGNIDIEDAVAVISHVNGVKSLSSSAMKLADVDSNGEVDIVDAVAIISHVNGVKPIGGGTVTTDRKLDALYKKYKNNYSLKLHNSTDNKELQYVFGAKNYYYGTYSDGTLDMYEVLANDGFTYLVVPESKEYYKLNLGYMPTDLDILGGAAGKFIKSETKGGITYEYYQAADYVFFEGGTLVYGFDSSSNLKFIEFKGNYEYDRSGRYDVVSLGFADKSKFNTPNLSGYTQKEE